MHGNNTYNRKVYDIDIDDNETDTNYTLGA